jgi:hypothetical protein
VCSLSWPEVLGSVPTIDTRLDCSQVDSSLRPGISKRIGTAEINELTAKGILRSWEEMLEEAARSEEGQGE